MLERVRFSTKDPDALGRELDRFLNSVDSELRRLERQSARKLTLAETVSGRTGVVTQAFAAFDTILPVNCANGDVDVVLPAAARADAGRVILIERLSTSSVVRLQAGTRLVNNNTASVTLPTTRAAYLAEWDGIGFWTVNDAV